MRFFSFLSALLPGAALALALASCGDSGGGSDDITDCPECGPAREGYAKGALLAPNGDPIAGARVWSTESPTGSEEPDTSCFPAPSEATSSDCTDSQGIFELRCDSEESSELLFRYVAGGVSGALVFPCGDTPSRIRIRESAGESLAVVTGEFDRMEDVLAKLGFAGVGENGRVSAGTESFTVYRGGGAEDRDLALDPSRYKPAEELLTDPDEMGLYSLIFINCGEDTSATPPTSPTDPVDTPTETLLTRPSTRDAVRQNLREYVQSGGKIYVTDRSYDFIEQVFPEFIDFLRADGIAESQRETANAAERGESQLTVDAELKEPLLAEWLDQIRVNEGLVDDCSTAKDSSKVNAVMGACSAGKCTEGGTLLIGDFADDWAVAQSAHSSKTDDVKIWMDGEADFYPDDSGIPVSEVVPLVMTFEFGKGRVLFTSYHTSSGCQSTGFWPQERVLQYLLFAI